MALSAACGGRKGSVQSPSYPPLNAKRQRPSDWEVLWEGFGWSSAAFSVSQQGVCLWYPEERGNKSEKLSKNSYKVSDFIKPFDFQENCGCSFMMCRRKWKVALQGNSNPVKCSYATVRDPTVMGKWQTMMVYGSHGSWIASKQNWLKNSCPSLCPSHPFLTAYPLGRQLWQHCTRRWTQDRWSHTNCRISIAERLCFIHIISVTWLKAQLHIHIAHCAHCGEIILNLPPSASWLTHCPLLLRLNRETSCNAIQLGGSLLENVHFRNVPLIATELSAQWQWFCKFSWKKKWH